MTQEKLPSQASICASRSLISPRSLSASWTTLPCCCSTDIFWSCSALMRLFVSSNCFCKSFFIASILLVLSTMSWTAEPPDWRARVSSFLASWKFNPNLSFHWRVHLQFLKHWYTSGWMYRLIARHTERPKSGHTHKHTSTVWLYLKWIKISYLSQRL